MRSFLDKLEDRIRSRAVPHLTAVMIGCFVLGYLVELMYPSALDTMSLNIHMILRGQIWRIITWVIIPPQSPGIFTVIMLFFYFSIGTTLERTWGDARYNIYLLGGIVISVIAAFITYFVMSAFYPAIGVGAVIGQFFTTYNICMSILLAYAATFPDATVLLMFVIPLKMEYLGFVYGAYIAYDCIRFIRFSIAGRSGLYLIYVIAIIASLVNFAVFFFSSYGRVRMSAEQKKRRKEFRKSVEKAMVNRERKGADIINVGGVRHRCTICGRTDVSDPDLEFRYCSQCAGEYEYCMDHLKNHTHIMI